MFPFYEKMKELFLQIINTQLNICKYHKRGYINQDSVAIQVYYINRYYRTV